MAGSSTIVYTVPGESGRTKSIKVSATTAAAAVTFAAFRAGFTAGTALRQTKTEEVTPGPTLATGDAGDCSITMIRASDGNHITHTLTNVVKSMAADSARPGYLSDAFVAAYVTALNTAHGTSYAPVSGRWVD